MEEAGDTFASHLAEPDIETEGGSHYVLGEAVLGQGCTTAGGGGDGCASLAPVLLPALQADGSCGSGGWRLPFLRSVEPYACSVGAVPLGTACGFEYAAQRVSLLRQGLGLDSDSQASALSGAIASHPGAAAADVAVEVMLRTADSAPFSAVSAAPSSSWDGATCRDALVGLQLRLLVGDDGTITNATAYLDVRTLVTAGEQTFAAKFEYASELGRTDLRPVSGRPGYQRGLPLLVADGTPGDVSSLKLRMEATPLLRRGEDGTCDSSASGGDVLLTFGDETAASCVAAFASAAELRTWCELAPAMEELPELAALNLSWTDSDGELAWLGALGDAHPESPSDWVALQLADPIGGRVWDESRQICTNVLSSIEVQVLYAEVGAALHPAKKIVGARLTLGTRSVRGARCAAGGRGGCATRFALTVSTRFVQLTEGRSYTFVPKLPRIFPPFPEDFLYPFYGRSAADDERRLGEEPSRWREGAVWALLAVPAGGVLVAAAARSRGTLYR